MFCITLVLEMQDCLKRCVDLVGKGASVFFFPEDTRSRDGKLGVFKVRFYQTISYFSVHYAFNFFLEQ